MLSLTELLLLIKQSELLLAEAIKQGNTEDMQRFMVWRAVLKDEVIAYVNGDRLAA